MKRCKVFIFVKVLRKNKRCIRLHKHPGSHTPDLKGEVFGQAVVKELGKPKKHKNKNRLNSTNTTTWIVDRRGFLNTVWAASLLSGQFKGVYEITGFNRKNGVQRPEYTTVRNHHKHIFNPSCKENKTYKGVPFYDDWNPDKNGTFAAGVKWILENLGERPGKKWTLDIIDHDKGFVPGNLRWANWKTQSDNKRHKKLGRYTLQELRIEVKRYGYKLVKI